MTHIYGVDFSGAADAGRHIWLTRADASQDSLAIIDIFPASSLAAGRVTRDEIYPVLRTWIAAQTDCLIGMDFPFSLHQSQLNGTSWVAFAQEFGERVPSPQHFYNTYGGRGRELRRQTDAASRTPFAPTNLRIYRQTYFGLRDLLAPLANEGSAVVFPMQEPSAKRPVLIEVCPAVTLARLGLRKVRYKEASAASREQRRQIIAGLRQFSVIIPPNIESTLLSNARGDALDSVIAAYSAAAAERGDIFKRLYSPVERLEGVVYA